MEPLMTTKEAAQFLGISVDLLHTLKFRPAPEGIPCYRVGRSYRFRQEELEEYLEARRVKPPEAQKQFRTERIRYVPGMKVV